MKYSTRSIRFLTLLLVFALGVCAACAKSEAPEQAHGYSKLRIATVNNPDMVIMEELSKYYTQQTGVEVEFVFFSENDLRNRVIEDLAIGASAFDIVTIGTYDVPFWAENHWIASLEPYFDNMSEADQSTYDRSDFLDYVEPAMTYMDDLYALPFYGETSILYYRTDLFEEAHLTMPDNPTWQDVYRLASQLNMPDSGQYGIILRGKKGWGMNMTVFNTIANAFGGRWYDMDWQAQFDSAEMREALEFYKGILIDGGQPFPENYGYLESLKLMQSSKAAMWYDASIAAGFLEGEDSEISGNVGYRLAPTYRKKDTGWLWAWVLAIESSSIHKEQAFDFLIWATHTDYTHLVAKEKGWQYVPAGTRKSTYLNPSYREIAPFSDLVLKAIQSVDYTTPTIEDVPYTGIQYLSIPRFIELGEQVSQYIADYLAGNLTLDEALALSQDICNRIAEEEGYK